MRKFLWWIAAILGLVGLSFFGNEQPGLGILFILFAAGIAAGIVYREGKETQEAQEQQEKELKEYIRRKLEHKAYWKKQDFPVAVSLKKGHYNSDGYWFENRPNYINSWDIRCEISNVSSRVINYIYLYVHPEDNLGSRLADTHCIKITGPLQPDADIAFDDKDKWWKLQVNDISIEKIVVEYSIGESQMNINKISVTALPGNGTASAWNAFEHYPDGTWGVKSVIHYNATSPASRLVIYAIPLSADGTKLAPAAELSTKQDWHSGQVMTVWWSGIWKGLPVARVRLEKIKIEYSNGTNLVV